MDNLLTNELNAIYTSSTFQNELMQIITIIVKLKSLVNWMNQFLLSFKEIKTCI